jgi:hypothetical protein
MPVPDASKSRQTLATGEFGVAIADHPKRGFGTTEMVGCGRIDVNLGLAGCLNG